MKNITELFEALKQNNSSQTIQGEAGKRLKTIVDEVEKMKRAMEDKQRQIQGTPPPNEQWVMLSLDWSSVHVQTR